MTLYESKHGVFYATPFDGATAHEMSPEAISTAFCLLHTKQVLYLLERYGTPEERLQYATDHEWNT